MPQLKCLFSANTLLRPLPPQTHISKNMIQIKSLPIGKFLSISVGVSPGKPGLSSLSEGRGKMVTCATLSVAGKSTG